MDSVAFHAEIMSIASAILLLLLNGNKALDLSIDEIFEDDTDNSLHRIQEANMTPILDVDVVTSVALHNFCLCNVFSLFDVDLGYWVKLRSTTWFSRFLFDQYEEDHWLKMFRITKPALFSLVELLKHLVQKQDTKYRLAVFVVVRVACSISSLHTMLLYSYAMNSLLQVRIQFH